MLAIKQYSGASVRGYIESTGWSKGGTNAAFILSVLLAKYSDFGWNEIEEFKNLNDIPDWEPNEDLSADGTLVGMSDGVILLPDGYDLSGWGDYYSDWKAGRQVAELPPTLPAQTVTPAPAYIPQNVISQPAPQLQPSSYTPAASPAPASSPASVQPSMTPASMQIKPGAYGEPDKNKDMIMWGIGLAAGGAILWAMLGNKKGKRK